MTREVARLVTTRGAMLGADLLPLCAILPLLTFAPHLPYQRPPTHVPVPVTPSRMPGPAGD